MRETGGLKNIDLRKKRQTKIHEDKRRKKKGETQTAKIRGLSQGEGLITPGMGSFVNCRPGKEEVSKKIPSETVKKSSLGWSKAQGKLSSVIGIMTDPGGKQWWEEPGRGGTQ